MVRTSRQAPGTVDPLDSLNLDDMFADGGDDIFDGLDIDLGNMDDLAAAEERKPPPAPAPDESPRRRTTKRKTKVPHFYDDDEDDEEFLDEPVKKKKRTSKGSVSKSRTKQASDETSTATFQSKASSTATNKSRGKSKNSSVVMPPPTGRGSSASHVAAAGRFGQAKRNKTKAPPRVVEVGQAKAAPKPPTAAPLTPSVSTTSSTLANDGFCGLLPSNKVFYPFMPMLPPEPSLKSRKIVPFIDRIHSKFLGQMTSSKINDSTPAQKIPESHPIHRLMLDSFRDEKSHPTNRSELVGATIANVRQTITFYDKAKLREDLVAVANLLKRQHDFIKQNNANMERWCKDNFNEEEYAEVYVPERERIKTISEEDTQARILSTFKVPEVKVRLSFDGFKDPKTGTLWAALPGSAATVSPKIKTETKKKSTKRKVPPTEPTKVEGPTKLKEPLAYSQKRPRQRRVAVAEMISRAARELENKYLKHIEDRRITLDKQEAEMHNAVENDSSEGLNTTAMWQWLSKAGYFTACTEQEIEWRLDGVVSPDIPATGLEQEEEFRIVRPRHFGEAVPLYDRLRSLLVDEDDGENDIENEGDLVDDDLDMVKESSPSIDLSCLSLDERTFLHLKRVGLVESLQPSDFVHQTADVESPSSTIHNIPLESINGHREHKNCQEECLDDVINAMVSDLKELNMINNRRVDFLKYVSRSHLISENDAKRRNEEEATLTNKCMQLLKKAKEQKFKGGKAKIEALKQNLALPW